MARLFSIDLSAAKGYLPMPEGEFLGSFAIYTFLIQKGFFYCRKHHMHHTRSKNDFFGVDLKSFLNVTACHLCRNILGSRNSP